MARMLGPWDVLLETLVRDIPEIYHEQVSVPLHIADQIRGASVTNVVAYSNQIMAVELLIDNRIATLLVPTIPGEGFELRMDQANPE